MLMQRKVPLTQFSSRTSFNLFFTVFYGKPQGKQINKQKPITDTTVYHQLVNMTSTNIGKNWPTNPQTGGTFGGLFNNEVTKTYMRIFLIFPVYHQKKFWFHGICMKLKISEWQFSQFFVILIENLSISTWFHVQ